MSAEHISPEAEHDPAPDSEGSKSCSRTSRARRSPVSGARRIPLRPWPVAA
ncbi:MAG: hypothetical protein JO355_02375 [Planctomycetaceae bacterium]|nr:hypothetical protein [Planctomycetaceae bacterium]